MNPCFKCPRIRGIVPPCGPRPSRIMLIGEGPSYEEDRVKIPFSGKTGLELRGTYLPILGLPASEIFITNACLCSQKGYVNPTPDQAMACASVHLGQQIQEVRPEIIVPMGAVACSLFPEIESLALQHGRPIPGKWGPWSGILFPMYHPSAGLRSSGFMIAMMQDMEDLRKLLLSLDRGEFTWPVDPYPKPDYQFVRNTGDLADYIEAIHHGNNWALGEDTESLPSGLGKMGGGPPFCLTFSHTPGTGRLIYIRDTHLIDAYRKLLYELLPLQLFHNYLHDSEVFDTLELPTEPFIDTMVRAYNLCLGGGGDDEDEGESRAGRGSLSLKVLAYRHCQMRMTSFKDTVYPHSLPHALTWLKKGRETFAPDSDRPPRCECGCLQQWHEPRGKTGNQTGTCLSCNQCVKWRKVKPVKRPEDKTLDLLYRKLNTLIVNVETGKLDRSGKPKDPWKQFLDWPEYDQATLLDTLGPIPLASIEHVPEPELVKYACLAGESLVLTDSGYKKIKDLVKGKYSGMVFGVDSNGKIVKRRVTGWYKIRHKEPVDWLSVSTKHSIDGRWGTMTTRFTPDHKILTPTGMKAVSELGMSDAIYLPYEKLDSNQLQVVLGSLLGDGTLSWRNKTGWCYLRVSHSIKQKQYLDWKKEMMQSLWSSDSFTPAGMKDEVDGREVNSADHYTFATVMHPEMSNYRHSSYHPIMGRVIGNWISDMDALGLAITYLDNGTLVGGKIPRIYMQRFDKPSVIKFLQHLKSEFGLDGTFYICRRHGKSMGYAIHIAKSSAELFFRIIHTLTPECVQYKLPESFKGKFVGRPAYSRGMFSTNVSRVYRNPLSKGRRGGIKTSYCIDVEEIHNFLTPYEVAKNCRDADATLRLFLFMQNLKPWIFWS